MKIRLAKIQTDATGDAEAVKSFNIVTNSLLKLDPRVVIHPWKTKSKYNFAKAMTKNSNKPSTKEKMNDYVDRLYIRENTFPYIRMLIGHDIHRNEFDDETFATILRDQGINL